MYGTLAGALAGRKIEFDRRSYTATVEGRIAGVGRTIAIKSIVVHCGLTVPPDALEATRRALAAHAQGCPAHESLKSAIAIRWDAQVQAGDQVVAVASESTG
ncbi:MAG: OsmC family protein [Candidatus Rokubacteria bacterium]|nr:OsmC family protein [Candidatus Rokubacteria bacterium]